VALVSQPVRDTSIAAFESANAQLSGVQFHPEVLHSEHGQAILKNWLVNIAKCSTTWTSANIAQTEIAKAQQTNWHKKSHRGLSGGVDSAVAAAIIQKAVGKQLTCVFVDHGLIAQVVKPSKLNGITRRLDWCFILWLLTLVGSDS